MSSFVQFWIDCFKKGWGISDGIVNTIGTIAIIVSGFLLWRKWNEHHKKWEGIAMKIAFWVFVGSFLVSTIFVAPFVKNTDSENATVSASKETLLYSNKWVRLEAKNQASIQAEAKKEKTKGDKRLDTLEQSQQNLGSVLLQAVTNPEPRLGMLKAYTELPTPVPPRLNGERFDLKSSGTALDSLFSKIDARETFEREKAKISEVLWLSNCTPTFDYFISNLRSDLYDLANANGDMVTWNYKGLPKSMLPDNLAYIKMETNSAWNFRISLRGSAASVSMDIFCGRLSATLDFNDSEKTMQMRVNFPRRGDIITKDFGVSGCETNLDDFITYIIAAQNKLVALTNVNN